MAEEIRNEVVSDNKVKEILDRDFKYKESEVDWHGLKIKVKFRIGFEDVYKLVNHIVSGCFGEDGEYVPEAREMATKVAMLSCFTDLEWPEDIDDKYLLVCGTDLVESVFDCIDPAQVAQIYKMIADKIGYELEMRTLEIDAKLGKVVDEFESITKLLGDTFGGINNETIERLASAIQDGAFDEERLAKAVLEMNTASGENGDEE